MSIGGTHGYVAVAASLIILMVSCGGSEGQLSNARVLVVGDSVTHLSQRELRHELRWARKVEVRAHDGYRTDELLATAHAGAEADPDIGIFMPGYNDVLQQRVDRAAVAEMMAVAADLPCSVWFLLPRDGGYDPAEIEDWNNRVRDAAQGHDNVHLATDWKRLVENSPDFTFVSKVDAVHPNREGQQAIATAMSHAARRACGTN